MIIDILQMFLNWHSANYEIDFEKYDIPIILPKNIDPVLLSKLSSLLAKDPLKRISISTLSKSNIFKNMNTKDFKDLDNNNIKEALGDIKHNVLKVDSHVKKGMVAIDQKLSKMQRNLNQFLPAIQENVMRVQSVTGVPNRFVLIPEKSSFMGSFYKKYRLYILCDCGFHMVKGDDIGYSMIQITELWKGIMIVAKILISIAIKQLIGLSDPGMMQGIESAYGLADKGMQMLPDIMQCESLDGIKDLEINMQTMTDGLRTIWQSLSKVKRAG